MNALFRSSSWRSAGVSSSGRMSLSIASVAASFAGVGGVIAGDMIEKLNADFFLDLAAAGLAGAVLAILVGLPALRIRGAYLAVVTLALAVCVDSYFLSPTYFPHNIPHIPDFTRVSLTFDAGELCVALF